MSVTMPIFINIFSHNQNTLYKQYYYVTTSSDTTSITVRP